MSVAMIGPKFYAWGKDGKPLAFGRLYTYAARTNTPKDTYRSEDQVVENTNPVILNGEGYADVYLDGSYKMVLKDSEDSEVWSADPVTSSGPSEWVSCLTATYLSPTSFKVSGNFTVQYDEGRRIRVDSNATNYSYGTIRSSVFAAGDTTVLIDEPVITTGLIGVCVSIVGPESRPTDEVLNIPTLNKAIEATFINEGDSLNIKERTSGDGGGAMWDVVLLSTVTANGDDIVACTGIPTLALVLRVSAEEDDLIRSNMYGIPNGADQTNLENFRAKFTSRKNPVAIFPGFQGINNPDCGSVLDLASFGGQGIGGFNPIGYVFHHYSDSRMVQMDNVGANNEILYLKNATNSIRRADQPADFIGSAKFISLNRQESDGAGGVTGTLEGFYISKDFELVWTQQTTGTATARFWNNVSAGSGFWTHEFKNSSAQQYIFRVDNGGSTPFSVQWISGANSTQVSAHKALQLKATDGKILLSTNTSVEANTPIRTGVYSRTALLALTGITIGYTAYLQDGSDKYPVHYDGSAWLKVSDNTTA